MFGLSFSRDDREALGEAARRQHSAWLTRVFRRGGGYTIPRIPVRPVSSGGYGPLMATVEGREWADAWWADTLDNDALA